MINKFEQIPLIEIFYGLKVQNLSKLNKISDPNNPKY